MDDLFMILNYVIQLYAHISFNHINKWIIVIYLIREKSLHVIRIIFIPKIFIHKFEQIQISYSCVN
jgi:hypothetical protein